MDNKHSDSKPQKKGSPLSGLLILIQTAWDVRIIRFLIIGAINTLFSYLVYALLIVIGLHYSIAVFISTVLGIIFNFFTTGRIVFKNKKNSLIFRFILVYAFTYLINVGFLRLLELLKMDMLIAGAIVTLPVALISYILNSIFTFETVKLKRK